jgi:chromosome segregation ATPase
MAELNPTIIVALLAFIPAVISVLITLSRRKTDLRQVEADISSKLSASSVALMDKMERRIEILSCRVSFLEGEVAKYQQALSEKETRILTLEREIATYNKLLDEKSDKISALEIAVSERNSVISSLEARIKELEEHQSNHE